MEKEYHELPMLLYPSRLKKDMLNARRLELNRTYPCSFLDDLMTESVAHMICRRNPQNVMKLFREMCSDTDVINYRLDALEDMRDNPRLSPSLRKIIRVLLECEHDMMSSAQSPDSFSALGACIESLESYISSAEELHSLYKSLNGLRSEAFANLFKELEDRYNSEDYANLKKDAEEVKSAVSGKIRSVTVAINFNEEMRPTAAGIVGFSDKPAGEKPGILSRILYKNAVRPDTVVMGKLRSGEANEDGYISPADKALFKSLESITEAYLAGLKSALKAYERLSIPELARLDEELEIFEGVIRINEAAESRGLEMCRPVFTERERFAEIKGLFDPCFFFKAAAADTNAKGDGLIVRNDLTMDENGRFFILTGANNGGKTTFVRGAGLCFLMAQTGFFVPAEKCTLSLCDFIFTHFPKEEETGINASRFTTEIKELKAISDRITPDSLLLMNESVQSTTPAECFEIAYELVRIFCTVGTRGIFATHIIDLARKCGEIAADPECAAVPVSIVAEVDENNGKRLYRIRKGEPYKHSYAADIFRSFGIDKEQVKKRLGKK